MPKATLNFVWIGEPCFDKGGQDVVGPELIDRNLKYHSKAASLEEFKNETNTLKFWCLKAHKKRYQDYFAAKKIVIEVIPIETYLSEQKAEDEAVVEILRIFTDLTQPNRNKVQDWVCLKDLFFNFLLATKGDYVLD